MTYARQLLYHIADKNGRSRDQMQEFIRSLQKEWYDTKQALMKLKRSDYDKLKFPGHLINLIMQKLGTQEKIDKMEIQSPVDSELALIKKKTRTEQEFNQIVNTLVKIMVNIKQNTFEEKYRTLKKTNQKIKSIIKYQQVVSILLYAGFQVREPGFVMRHINLAKLDEVLQRLEKQVKKQKFNPYEVKITSLQQKNDYSKLQNETTQGSMIYNEKLAELQKQREKMMSKPIKDRQLRVFTVKPSGHHNKMDAQFSEKQEFNEDQKIYMQNVKNILKKQMENPKFMNRRKQQYFDLLKQPCFTETTIRVKLPDNQVFECKFAPLETIEQLVNLFDELVRDKSINYYLYMTPPVQKLSGTILRKTFYQLGCVPRAIFYFKTDDKIKGTLMKNAKESKGLFKMF